MKSHWLIALVGALALAITGCTDPQPAGHGGNRTPTVDPNNPTGNTSGPWRGERGLNDTTTHSTNDDPLKPKTPDNTQIPQSMSNEGKQVGAGPEPDATGN
jgi:hypothetical protein